jgi:hypothetical protein
MKKLLALLTAIAVLSVSFATTVPSTKPALQADKIFIPIGKTNEKISLMELSVIKAKDLQELTGRKMNFAERLAFKTAQKKLRNNINNDGTIDSKKLEKFAKKSAGEGGGFHFGGFALGLLLGVIGVIIAYIINDDKKRSRRMWAWIGWAAWIVIWLALFL